jgi:hypothetical protein
MEIASSIALRACYHVALTGNKKLWYDVGLLSEGKYYKMYENNKGVNASDIFETKSKERESYESYIKRCRERELRKK